MMRFARRILSAVVAVATVGLCVATISVQDGCVLAEPPGELRRIPESRPTIVHASLVPSTSAVLTRFPSTFIVPVELADPNVEFSYSEFIDYNPLTGEGLVEAPRRSVYEASNNTSNTIGRTRTLTIAIPPPLETDRCHTIEVVVALRLKSETDPKNAHTPDERGGDIATWFYNPNGDLGGCPTLDAGIDASTDTDAAEGGAQ